MEEGARAAEGARVEDVVVLPGATIGPGARLRRSIVGPGAMVPPGAELDGTVAVRDPGESVALPEGVRRRNGLVVADLEGSGR